MAEIRTAGLKWGLEACGSPKDRVMAGSSEDGDESHFAQTEGDRLVRCLQYFPNGTGCSSTKGTSDVKSSLQYIIECNGAR